jgi:hypothetical protein
MNLLLSNATLDACLFNEAIILIHGCLLSVWLPSPSKQMFKCCVLNQLHSRGVPHTSLRLFCADCSIKVFLSVHFFVLPRARSLLHFGISTYGISPVQ